MNNKAFSFGMIALTTTLTTNILNCAITSVAGTIGFTMTQPYLLIRQLHIPNKTGTAATVSLWKGASAGNAAGTEIATGLVIPPNDYKDLWFPAGLRFDAADFLVGGSGTTLALTIGGFGEIGVSG